MINFKGKSILFIAPSFFGYEKSIKEQLSKLGSVVDYFDERPSNSFLTKALIRLGLKRFHPQVKSHYQAIERLTNTKKYDFVFVLNIEAMPYSFLAHLKERNPEAKFILYMWDSVLNKKGTIHYFPYFNSIFSFDENDCKKFSNITFRPLFFLEEYTKLAGSNQFKYDLSFIGTAHSDRFSLVQQIQEIAKNKQLRTYWYLYLQNRKLYLWNKISNKAYRNAHLDDFKYLPLAKEYMLNLIRESKIIVDIQHPLQMGLTMRTIEMLGACRKLITTNTSIKNYDFYSADNILIIDRDNPQISDAFLTTNYSAVDSKIYFKYSLIGWLDDIFNDR